MLHKLCQVIHPRTQGVLPSPKLQVFGDERRFRQKTSRKNHIPEAIESLAEGKTCYR